MDAKSLFRQEFDKAKTPLTDREAKAARALRNFIESANQNDGVEMSLVEFGSNMERVALQVSIDGSEHMMLMKLSYNAPMSDRVTASLITNYESFMDDAKGTFYDLEQPDHSEKLLGEIVKTAAADAAGEERKTRFFKAISAAKTP